MSKIVLQDVRGSYVYADHERKDGGYGIQIILDKKDPQIKRIQKIVEQVAREKFGQSIKMGMIKTPLRDGDKERDEEQYEGKAFFNANSNRKPGIVNRNNEPADSADIQELCYSGAYFHVSVVFYAFDTDGNKGVAAGFNNLMLRKEGDRLDGSTTAGEDFADYSEDEDDEWGDGSLDDEIPF